VVAASAPIIAGLLGRRFAWLILPVVVVELFFGVLIGPEVLELAHVDPVLSAFNQLGLAFLIFFAGYEISYDRIKGQPLKLAVIGWLFSLALAYSLAGGLEALGVVVSGLLTGSALATTALGTLVPVLADENKLGGRFGTNVLAIGAVGEFGPVLIVTLLLGATSSAGEQVALLVLFAVIAVLTGLIATGTVGRWFSFINERMDTSGQLPVRLTVLMLFALVVIAGDLGMDVILGAFAAGLILGMIIGDREARELESKLEAVGYGFLIPFFFIVSGMNLDVTALFSSAKDFLKLPLFFVLMLIVRGLPVWVLHRRHVPPKDLTPLALLASTQLPLVVAITSIGLDNGNMRPSTAAALVGAAALTVLIFPALALALMRKRELPQSHAAKPQTV
jgi:Kef-type K+ transport system membrane component KefB